MDSNLTNPSRNTSQSDAGGPPQYNPSNPLTGNNPQPPPPPPAEPPPAKPVDQSLGAFSENPAFPWTAPGSAPAVQPDPPPPLSQSIPAGPLPETAAPLQAGSQNDAAWPTPVSLPHASAVVAAPVVQSAPAALSPQAENIPVESSNGDGIPKTPVSIMQSSQHKFPIMLVTGIVLLVITGFSGSYIYFRTQSQAKKTNVVPAITPPVKEAAIPTVNPADTTNPFETEENENPFSNDSTYVNPFGEDETDVAETEYQNPFETESE